MKRLFVIAIAILLSSTAFEVSAQSALLKKIGQAVEKGIKNEVGKAVKNISGEVQQAKSKKEKTRKPQTPKTLPYAPAVLPEAQAPAQLIEYDPNTPDRGRQIDYEWVDLGLPSGLRWAAHNYGSIRPESPGEQYAWGAVHPKSEHAPQTNKYYGVPMPDFSGDMIYDPVRYDWGRGWRIPTVGDFQELMDNCDREYVEYNGMYGVRSSSRVTSESIFFPLTGYQYGWDHLSADTDGMYWTSTPYTDDNTAYMFHFASDEGEMYYAERYIGCSIRPVSDWVKVEKYITTGTQAGREWVDLALPSGTRWATCNVDASVSSQPGKLYAWGETASKSTFSESTSKYKDPDAGDIAGDSSKDVATSKWGNGWRMPTRKEFEEMVLYCDWKYTKVDGRWGVMFTSSRNGESIFLPATGHKEGSEHYEPNGCGSYWTSTPGENMSAHSYSYGAALGEMGRSGRCFGLAVRPVLDKASHLEVPSSGQKNGHDWVDMGLPSGTKWATLNIGAPAPEIEGYEFAWGEIIPGIERSAAKHNFENDKNAVCIAGNPDCDAAAAFWGEGWQTPTDEQFQELIDNCVWEWVTMCARSGYKVTSKLNQNWIFLPACLSPDKEGAYWTSSPERVDHGSPVESKRVHFSHRDNGIFLGATYRFSCFNIRPVTR